MAVSFGGCYRNRHRICTVADGLAKEPTDEPTMLETSKYPEHQLESTVEPLPFPTLDQQCDELIDRLDIHKRFPSLESDRTPRS
jgi:hypothetical protein